MKVSYESSDVMEGGERVNKSASQCRQDVVYAIALINVEEKSEPVSGIEEVGTRLFTSKKSEPVPKDRRSRNPSLNKQEVGTRP